MALKVDDISINTIIGKGSSITGNLRINGFVRLDGDINGNLETDGNIIWKAGIKLEFPFRKIIKYI